MDLARRGSPGPRDQDARPRAGPPGAEASELALSAVYPLFEALGLQYGPSFRGLREVRTLGSRTWAEVGPDALPADAAALTGPHPVLLDSGLQSLLLQETGSDASRLLMPFEWGGVRRYGDRAPERVRVQLTRTGDDTYEVLVVDPEGAPVLSVDSLTVREAASAVRADRDALFHLEWEEVSAPDAAVTADPGTWAVSGGAALGIDRRPEDGDEAPAVVVVDEGRTGAPPPRGHTSGCSGRPPCAAGSRTSATRPRGSSCSPAAPCACPGTPSRRWIRPERRCGDSSPPRRPRTRGVSCCWTPIGPTSIWSGPPWPRENLVWRPGAVASTHRAWRVASPRPTRVPTRPPVVPAGVWTPTGGASLTGSPTFPCPTALWPLTRCGCRSAPPD
ncbi:polyketide synthase dehydratase domain-containing protein [Nocardiopsis eucommiae]|uniref:Polyketide synthase dehydratase domain-containing protein n=1 Tax=Nocardiopsis eucommiae TaxID=2831970 RepID=A0A975L8U3_9ACTN|nr:polyketide synthase dehydratase domain-containing protein [Nocardiopsis eucommiae]